MGKEVEFVAVRVIAVTTGLLGLRSKENTTARPPFSNAVMLGMPPARAVRHNWSIHFGTHGMCIRTMSLGRA